MPTPLGSFASSLLYHPESILKIGHPLMSIFTHNLLRSLNLFSANKLKQSLKILAPCPAPRAEFFQKVLQQHLVAALKHGQVGN